jgi:urate oxidase
MARLGPNRYGKAEVRVVRVARGAGPGGGDVIRDWNVSTSLSGDLDAASLAGDNSHVLPTDSHKNRVYALARELGPVPPETFGLKLASYFVTSQEPITRARVAIEEYGWSPVGATGYSFARSGELVRSTTVVLDAEGGASVVSGISDLVVLNTTASEFWGYPRDEYTTLPDTKDRMLSTAVSARWRYRPAAVSAGGDSASGDSASGDSAGAGAPGIDWDAAFGAAKSALIAAFAGTYSYSLQQTLYAMATRVLADVPQACEVRLALPNKHHYLVDLGPFGLDNPNEVYNAGDRPYGLIEGHVLADDAPDEGLAWT